MAPKSLVPLAITLSLLMVTSALPSKRHHNDIIRGKTMESSPRPTDVSNVVDCPENHYYSEVGTVCIPCRHCPANEIIRSPCSARADTVCGPFYEFDQFHQSKLEVPSLKSSKKEDDTKEHQQKNPNTEDKPEDSEGGNLTLLGPAGKQWRNLSYALITALCFICCVVTFLALYVCIVCRRPEHLQYISGQTELLSQYPDEEDSEPRYVDTSIMSRHGSRTSRHLPVYQHISEASLFPALTSSSCDAKPTNMAATQRDEEDHDYYIYINTAAMDSSDV